MNNFKSIINAILVIVQTIFYGVMIAFAIMGMSTLDATTAFIKNFNTNIEIEYAKENNG